MTLTGPLVDHEPYPPIISPGTPGFGTTDLFRYSGFGSFAWPVANKPIAVPFFIWQPMTVAQLGWANGSGTMTDSVDVGVYDSAWNRKVSTGSTARSGANNLQVVNVTDTPLTAPGLHYLVMSNNGTTANQQRGHTGSVLGMMKLLGCFDSGTNAFALPDPLTNMVLAATFTQVPLMFICTRAVF